MSEGKEFKDFGLKNELLIQNICQTGWTKPWQIQEIILPLAISGKSISVLATGGGMASKGSTGSFIISVLERLDPSIQEIQALICVPTKDFAWKSAKIFSNLSQNLNVRALVTTRAQPIAPEDDVLRALKQQKFHMVIATPGRLLGLLENSFHPINADQIKVLILDEADQIFEGCDNENLMAQVMELLPRNKVQILACSARDSSSTNTIVQNFMTKYANDPHHIRLNTEITHSGDAETSSSVYCEPDTDSECSLDHKDRTSESNSNSNEDSGAMLEKSLPFAPAAASFTCGVCKKVFRKAIEFSKHSELHDREFPFECPRCEMVFGKEDALKLHLPKHVGDVQCSKCDKWFPNFDRLTKHQRVRHRVSIL